MTQTLRMKLALLDASACRSKDRNLSNAARQAAQLRECERMDAEERKAIERVGRRRFECQECGAPIGYCEHTHTEQL